jgi:hypothetical protein
VTELRSNDRGPGSASSLGAGLVACSAGGSHDGELGTAEQALDAPFEVRGDPTPQFADTVVRAGGGSPVKPCPGGIQASGSFLVIAAEGHEGQPPFVEIRLRDAGDVTFSELQRFTLPGDLGEPVAPRRFITAAALTRLLNGLLYCHAYKANTDLLGSPDSKLKVVEYAP